MDADTSTLDNLHLEVSVYQALTGADHKQKRVAALRAVAAELIKVSVPGCNRICDASDKTLSDSVLRFSSKHKSPAQNKQWKFTLAYEDK